MKKIFTILLLAITIFAQAKASQASTIDAALMHMLKERFDYAEMILESATADEVATGKLEALRGLNAYKAGKIISAQKYLITALKFYAADSVLSPEIIPVLQLLSRIDQSQNHNMTSSIMSHIIDGGRYSAVLNDDATILDDLAKLDVINEECHKEMIYTKLIGLRDSIYANKIHTPLTFALEEKIEELDAAHNFFLLYPPTNLYAGIEIGSKGVKLSVIKLKSTLNGDYAYSIEQDSAINTDIIFFDDYHHKTTIEAVYKMYQLAVEKSIPDSKIFIAISNGVEAQAFKQGKLSKLKDIQDDIRSKIGMKSKEVYVLSESDEPKLTHLGCIPQKGRDQASILDIGSGNTKGGNFQYNSSSSFIHFSFDFGSKAFVNFIDKRDGNISIQQFANSASKIMDSVSINHIHPILSSQPALFNKENVILSGGISWVIATLTNPLDLENAFVPITIEDVKRIKKMAIENYPEMVKIDNYLYKIPLESQTKASQNIGKVFDAFDQKTIIAGSEILERMLHEYMINSTMPKKFYLARYGHIGWITGQIIRSLGGD